jgi:hypothetical protein
LRKSIGIIILIFAAFVTVSCNRNTLAGLNDSGNSDPGTVAPTNTANRENENPPAKTAYTPPLEIPGGA